jgi:hypothetical protein
MKRILLVSLSAVALSGCSWLGYGQNDYNNDGWYGGQYAPQAQVQKPAQPCCDGRLSKWNVEAGVGPSFIIGGEGVSGDKINPSGGTDINELDMDELYDTGLRAEGGISKALTPNRKVSLIGHYVNHDSKGVVDWGTVGGTELTGSLSDYKAYGAELGLRQYGGIKPFPLVNSVRPYVEGRVGASYVEDIDIQGASIAPTTDIAFYEGGWTPTAAGLIGVETPFFGKSTIGVETGLRYTHKLDTDRSVLAAGSPLAGSNDAGEKWSIPLTLRGRYRF